MGEALCVPRAQGGQQMLPKVSEGKPLTCEERAPRRPGVQSKDEQLVRQEAASEHHDGQASGTTMSS